MLLDAYLSKTAKTDAAFADAIGVGRSMVTKLRHRKARPSFETALKIERETGGAVRVEDLEPVGLPPSRRGRNSASAA